mmetsp:Transcript_130989/g.407374  ORF Transcript_130989/g.407374 Transcript_130989/m.407374 type:complete len:221 (-) Transcript_130989:181-843(-)
MHPVLHLVATRAARGTSTQGPRKHRASPCTRCPRGAVPHARLASRARSIRLRRGDQHPSKGACRRRPCAARGPHQSPERPAGRAEPGVEWTCPCRIQSPRARRRRPPPPGGHAGPPPETRGRAARPRCLPASSGSCGCPRPCQRAPAPSRRPSRDCHPGTHGREPCNTLAFGGRPRPGSAAPWQTESRTARRANQCRSSRRCSPWCPWPRAPRADRRWGT